MFLQALLSLRVVEIDVIVGKIYLFTQKEKIWKWQMDIIAFDVFVLFIVINCFAEYLGHNEDYLSSVSINIFIKETPRIIPIQMNKLLRHN